MKNFNLNIVGHKKTGKTLISETLLSHGFKNHINLCDFFEGEPPYKFLSREGWDKFVEAVRTAPVASVVDWKGIGGNNIEVLDSIKKSKQKWRTIYCIASADVLLERRNEGEMGLDRAISDELVIKETEEMEGFHESNFYETPSMVLNTSAPIEATIEEILKFVNA